MFIIILIHSCISMADPLEPSGPGTESETVKARGRGVGILMAIKPPISKKDIHPIRQRMERALSDSFDSVELSYYPKDPTSTHLKIVADLAKFRLDPADILSWYSPLLERFLRQFLQDLKELHYSIEEVQVSFLARPSPREKERDFIPLPTPEETAVLQSVLARIIAPPPTEPSPPKDTAQTTEDSSVDTTAPGKEPLPVPWLERDLADAEERSYRTKALREYQENHFEEGVQTCVSGLESYPNSPFLLYLLSTLLIAQQKDRDALGVLDHLIQAYPNCAQAYLQRSGVRLRTGDREGSEKDRVKARELNPDLVAEE
jgi:TolA-binding protein